MLQNSSGPGVGERRIGLVAVGRERRQLAVRQHLALGPGEGELDLVAGLEPDQPRVEDEERRLGRKGRLRRVVERARVDTLPAQAGHEHRAWRLSTVQELARQYAPARVNALASDDKTAIAAALFDLGKAEGVTGQYLPLDGNGAVALLSSQG